MYVARNRHSREMLYQALCRRYRVKPEPSGCWHIWPDVIKRLWRESHHRKIRK